MNGNVLIAHGGGPTTVINGSLYGVLQESRSIPGLGTVYGAVHGIEGVLKEELINLSSAPESEIELLPHTPASAIGSCRRKLTEADYERILDVLKRHDIGYFLYNGGNDSMDTCHKMSLLAQKSGYDLKVVGIPKTIDNDLAFTDHCPGYGSAARFVANNTRDLWMEVRAMPRFVTILETMGRNAGWLTAAASLPIYRGQPCAQLIYLPERAFDRESFLRDVDALLHKQKEILIVCSEGLHDASGRMVSDLGMVDGFGHTLAGGSSQFLADLIVSELRVSARAERHGFLGRCSMVMQSGQDLREAIDVGRRAMRLCAEGKSGVMVTIEREEGEPYRYHLGDVPLSQVANVEKKFPDAWIAPEGNHVTEAFCRYALPLIGDPLPPYAYLR